MTDLGLYEDELIGLILTEHFEYGFDTRADVLVRELVQQNVSATMDWLSSLFFSHLDSVPITVGLLRVVARIDCQAMGTQDRAMAIAALSHTSPEVQECGVRAFESWEDTSSVEILSEFQTSIPWLREYTDHVVRDLRVLRAEDEEEDLKLASCPQFVASMTQLIDGIESGTIDVSQWKRIE